MSAELLNAFDFDKIEDEAQLELRKIPQTEITPAIEEQIRAKAQQKLANIASSTFNGELNEYIVTVRNLHDQKIDTVNIDTVVRSGFNSFTQEKAKETIKSFTEYLEQHKDEIMALSIFYNQPYRRRELTLQMAQELLEKIKQDKPLLAPSYVWDAYCAVASTSSKTVASTGSATRSAMPELVEGRADTKRSSNKIPKKPISELTALVSLVRHACGIDKTLAAFDSVIDKNFNAWLFRQHTGNRNRFTQEQIDWLRMIKDHIISSYHLDLDDLDYTPFDAQGGRGKMYQLFGNEMEQIINELNEVLVA